jgi:proline iminopeptidase
VAGFSADSLRITVSDGTELHVTVRGEGIPCLYIHGGPGVGSYWMEELYGDELEKHFQMIYLDQRGSGRSGSAATGNYSPERMAKDFEEIRQQLNIDSWITLGHSFGGLLQMDHATRYPGTVRGMIMVAPTLNLNESAEAMIDFAVQELEINGEARKASLDNSKYPIDRLMPLFIKLREQDVFWKAYYNDKQNSVRMDSVMAEVSAHNYEFSSRAFNMPAYYQNYKPMSYTVNAPVLLYFGRRDFAVGPNHYQNINFPTMSLHFWDGGHLPFMEGKEALEAVIISWLEKHESLRKF